MQLQKFLKTSSAPPTALLQQSLLSADLFLVLVKICLMHIFLFQGRTSCLATDSVGTVGITWMSARTSWVLPALVPGTGEAWGWKEAVYCKIKQSMCVCVCVDKHVCLFGRSIQGRRFCLTTMWTSAWPTDMNTFQWKSSSHIIDISVKWLIWPIIDTCDICTLISSK